MAVTEGVHQDSIDSTWALIYADVLAVCTALLENLESAVCIRNRYTGRQLNAKCYFDPVHGVYWV